MIDTEIFRFIYSLEIQNKKLEEKCEKIKWSEEKFRKPRFDPEFLFFFSVEKWQM